MQFRHVIVNRLDHTELQQTFPVASDAIPRVGSRIEVTLGDAGDPIPARVTAVLTVSRVARAGMPQRPAEVTVRAEELA